MEEVEIERHVANTRSVGRVVCLSEDLRFRVVYLEDEGSQILVRYKMIFSTDSLGHGFGRSANAHLLSSPIPYHPPLPPSHHAWALFPFLVYLVYSNHLSSASVGE